MNPSIEQLLKVQEVDSQMIFLKETLRLRPKELDDDRKKTADTKVLVEAIAVQIKKLKLESAQRELDVKSGDAEIEKLTVALKQAKSNQEYTIFSEQIKKQKEARGKLEDEVLGMFGEIDTLEARRKGAQAALETATNVLRRKETEMNELLAALRGQIQGFEAQRAGLVTGIDPEALKLYERVLARHNNFAIARVSNQICQGCYMSVTTQEIALLRMGQFLQCKSCSRLLYPE